MHLKSVLELTEKRIRKYVRRKLFFFAGGGGNVRFFFFLDGEMVIQKLENKSILINNFYLFFTF